MVVLTNCRSFSAWCTASCTSWWFRPCTCYWWSTRWPTSTTYLGERVRWKQPKPRRKNKKPKVKRWLQRHSFVVLIYTFLHMCMKNISWICYSSGNGWKGSEEERQLIPTIAHEAPQFQRQANQRGGIYHWCRWEHIVNSFDSNSAEKTHQNWLEITKFCVLNSGDLCRCLCCPRPAENPASAEFKAVQHEVLETKVSALVVWFLALVYLSWEIRNIVVSVSEKKMILLSFLLFTQQKFVLWGNKHFSFVLLWTKTLLFTETDRKYAKRAQRDEKTQGRGEGTRHPCCSRPERFHWRW